MQSPTLAAAVGNLEAEAIAQVKILPNGLRLEKIDLAFLLLKKKKKSTWLFVRPCRSGDGIDFEPKTP